jgi:hypothetical protein
MVTLTGDGNSTNPFENGAYFPFEATKLVSNEFFPIDVFAGQSVSFSDPIEKSTDMMGGLEKECVR